MSPIVFGKISRFSLSGFCLSFIMIVASIGSVNGVSAETFCDRLPRAAYADLTKHKASDDWFEVYEVEAGTFAIYEPFQWEEVISYLIVGSDTALLFDTGNGLDNVKKIVDQLTDKPIKVLNSHSHYDHIGGNHQFEKILSPTTDFSIENSKGRDDDYVKFEASPEALCRALPEGVTQENHHIKPYSIEDRVVDGQIIDLGDRQLEIIFIPGHTDDSVALFDKGTGMLWTGDSFYVGPIFLESPETDLDAYRSSLAKMVALLPEVKYLMPAHNTTMVAPSMLVEVQKAFDQILEGKVKPVAKQDFPDTITFDFKKFSFVLHEDYRSHTND